PPHPLSLVPSVSPLHSSLFPPTLHRPPRSTLFPYTTLFRSTMALMFALFINAAILIVSAATFYTRGQHNVAEIQDAYKLLSPTLDRKSTRLNSSHLGISYAVFCLKKKKAPNRYAEYIRATHI